MNKHQQKRDKAQAVQFGVIESLIVLGPHTGWLESYHLPPSLQSCKEGVVCVTVYDQGCLDASLSNVVGHKSNFEVLRYK